MILCIDNKMEENMKNLEELDDAMLEDVAGGTMNASDPDFDYRSWSDLIAELQYRAPSDIMTFPMKVRTKINDAIFKCRWYCDHGANMSGAAKPLLGLLREIAEVNPDYAEYADRLSKLMKS